MRTIGLGLMALVLSACVLHEKTPLFSESDAVPILGSQKTVFAIYDRKDGAWVASDDPTFAALPEGNHYLIPDPTTPDDLASADRFDFIPLDAGHFAVQLRSDGEADYAIATWDGTELLVRPLDCDALKSSGKSTAIVAFEDDACTLHDSTTSPRDLLAQLLPAAPEPTLRLVKQ